MKSIIYPHTHTHTHTPLSKAAHQNLILFQCWSGESQELGEADGREWPHPGAVRGRDASLRRPEDQGGHRHALGGFCRRKPRLPNDQVSFIWRNDVSSRSWIFKMSWNSIMKYSENFACFYSRTFLPLSFRIFKMFRFGTNSHLQRVGEEQIVHLDDIVCERIRDFERVSIELFAFGRKRTEL